MWRRGLCRRPWPAERAAVVASPAAVRCETSPHSPSRLGLHPDAACSMSPATAAGCDRKIEWLPATSTVVTPARSAICRWAAGAIDEPPVDKDDGAGATHDGLLREERETDGDRTSRAKPEQSCHSRKPGRALHHGCPEHAGPERLAAARLVDTGRSAVLLLTTLSGSRVRLRLPPQAARTEGPPRTRTRRRINRAKRTLRPGRSTPPRGMTRANGALGW
jgi:hypothetical protein